WEVLERARQANGDLRSKRHEKPIGESGLDVLLVDQGTRTSDPRCEHRWYRGEATGGESNVGPKAPYQRMGLANSAQDSNRVDEVLEVPVAAQLARAHARERQALR